MRLSSSSASTLSGLTMAMLGLLAAGCADRTAILVEVTSPELVIPTEVDSLTIRVQTEFDVIFEQTYPVSTTWPHSLTIVPPPMEGVGSARIDVTGNLAGEFVVRRIVRGEFTPGETRRVSVVLTRTCVDVRCPDAYDCVNGRCCVSASCIDPDAGMGDAGMSDGGDDSGIDAPELDTGMMTLDTGIDAPMSMMDGGFDAGRDAGFDAGRDAGFDAGRDAGTDAGRDAPLPPGARLVINEVDYDQAGTDAAEFVEIYNAGSSAASLTGLALLLIDGAGRAEYGRATLSGTLAAGGYLVVGIAGQTLTVPGGVTRVDITGSTSIQNGPDGLALVNLTSMTIVDRFTYETPSVTMATIFGGPVTLVEGTAFTTADSDTALRSLCRMPNGTDADNAATDWASCPMPTLGAAN